MEIKSFANQRKLTIHRNNVETKKGQQRPYLMMYEDLLAKASKDLNGGEFKLYIYLVCNQDNYTFFFSSADVAECMGISQDTVHNAFNGLLAKKYLQEVSHNVYSFYDDNNDTPFLISSDTVEMKNFTFPNEEAKPYTFQELVNRVGETTATNLWKRQ